MPFKDVIKYEELVSLLSFPKHCGINIHILFLNSYPKFASPRALPPYGVSVAQILPHPSPFL